MRIHCANCESIYDIDGATGDKHVVRCEFCSAPDSGRVLSTGGFAVEYESTELALARARMELELRKTEVQQYRERWEQASKELKIWKPKSAP